MVTNSLKLKPLQSFYSYTVLKYLPKELKKFLMENLDFCSNEQVNNDLEKVFPLKKIIELSQKKLKVRYKQLEELLKLPAELTINNSAVDNEKLTSDKDKAEKNKRFLNTLKNDIYINEAVKVTNKMIAQTILARQGKFTSGAKN
jgi:hypothetical protein